MLTTDQKETILHRAGVVVPSFSFRRLPDQQQQADAAPIFSDSGQADGQHNLAERHVRTINALFIEYSTARAAQSLREAEEARFLGTVRRAPDGSIV